MNNQNNKSNIFGPFKFTGIIKKKSINIYNISLGSLKDKYKFQTIKISEKEASFLVGDIGKKLRYHIDRSLRLHMPQSIINKCDKKIKVNIYTKDMNLANLFDHIAGKIKLNKNNIWFKADSSRKFSNATQITICAKPLTEYFYKNNIDKVYIDKRKNYVIIQP